MDLTFAQKVCMIAPEMNGGIAGMTTVMLADDEITVLQGLRQLYDWEGNGFQIVGEAMDGIAALNMALEKKPEIVLMDINMPLMSGLDVVARINESLPDTVVMMISGYNDAFYMRQAIRCRVFDYIVKPICFGDLSESLGRARMQLLSGKRREAPQIQQEPEQQPVIRQMVAYLNEHISEEVSLRRLSGIFHMNASYISQFFKNETGMNYSAYLLMLRLNRAKALLKGTDKSVGEVAQTVGFRDYRVFSRAFKQETGLTPSQYRAQKDG